MGRTTLIIIVFAAALFCGGTVGACQAPANLIPNPGFEDDGDHDGIPDGWGKRGDRDSRLLLEKRGHAGTKAIAITGKGAWRCRIKGRLPQGWYLLSFWVRRDGFVDGEYPRIRIFGRDITFDELFSWGSWVRLSRLLYLGDDRETDEIALINPGMKHTVWFDDVRLLPFTITTMYPKDGAVIAQGPPLFAWSMPEDGRVYTIEIALSSTRDPGVKKVYTTYSPQGNLYWVHESLPPGAYSWRITVSHNGTFIAASHTGYFAVSQPLLPVARKNAPLQLPAPARTLDGFFPLGIYGVPVEALPEIKGAGFNSVQTYRRDAKFLKGYIERANDLGLKVMIPYPDRENEKTLHAFLDEIKASQAILAWYLADEPEGKAMPPSYIWRWRRFLSHVTPFPGALVLVRAKRAWDYAPATDILMVDPYPIPQMPITWLSDSLEEAKKWSGGKPVWAVIQAFDWSASPLKDDPRSWGRYPTYEEERCLSYLALVHGATGLFYYTFEAKKFGTEDYLQHWNNIKKVVSELKSIYPLLLAPVDATRHLKVHPPGVHWAFKRVKKKQAGGLIKKGHYLIAVNTTKRFLRTSFSIPPLLHDEVGVLFEKRSVPAKRGKFIDQFKPYEVHLYGPFVMRSP